MRSLSHLLMSSCLYVLRAAVARSFSDDSAISCVLLVLWMTSCFSHNDANGPNQNSLFRLVRQMAAPGAKLLSTNDLFQREGLVKVIFPRDHYVGTHPIISVLPSILLRYRCGELTHSKS